MPTSAYYVSVQTRDTFTSTDYAQTAGQIVQALYTTLGDRAKLGSVVHSTAFTDPRVEVEVSQLEHAPTSPIIARCVVQADAPTKLAFDKNLFTNMLRVELPLPVTISKRVVPKDEQIAAAALAEEPPPEEEA